MKCRFPARSVLSLLGAAGALLTCFAVVLNVGDVGTAAKRELAQAKQIVPPISVGRSETAEDTRPHRHELIVETTPIQKEIVPPIFVGRSETAEDTRPQHQELIVETTPIQKQIVPPIFVGRPETAEDTRPQHQELIVETTPIQKSVDLPSKSLPVEIPEPATQPSTSIVGIWAPDAGACSVRYFRDGLLPTIINMDGAWAGETFCIFSNHKQTETGWSVAANCSNSREQWTTQVRLTVRGDRLKWTSKRGTQGYTRCAPDFLLAKAH